MIEKNYKKLINAMFSVKGRYPNTIITLSEENNDISLNYRRNNIGYQIDIMEQYENPMVYSIVVYEGSTIISVYDDYDIRKFYDVEHIYIKLVKLLEENI